jgi:hypothetical protein
MKPLEQAITTLWGSKAGSLNSFLSALSGDSATNFKLSKVLVFQQEFILPAPVVSYLGLGPALGDGSNFAGLLTNIEGKLTGIDKYEKPSDGYDGYGMPDILSLFGINQFWALLTQNCNISLNELFNDIRFDGNDLQFALYRRLKPFCLRETFESSGSVEDKISLFKYVKRHPIVKEEIVGFNAGTNWRDRVNFIEMRASPNFVNNNYSSQIKIDGQEFDQGSITRDGFRPLPVNNSTSDYLPFPDNSAGKKASMKEFTNWKYLLREWYFNTHVLLNGAIQIIGQDNYIGVGDNIMIPASILGGGGFNSSSTNVDAFIMAHVESISHSFTVTPGGARTFVTNIKFIRGVFTDKNGDNPTAGGGFLPALPSFGASGAAAPLLRALDDSQSQYNDVDDGGSTRPEIPMKNSNDPRK